MDEDTQPEDRPEHSPVEDPSGDENMPEGHASETEENSKDVD